MKQVDTRTFLAKCSERICHFCTSNKLEDENHFLLDFKAYSQIRDKFFSKLETKIPDFKSLSHDTLISLLMNSSDFFISYCTNLMNFYRFEIKIWDPFHSSIVPLQFYILKPLPYCANHFCWGHITKNLTQNWPKLKIPSLGVNFYWGFSRPHPARIINVKS